MENGDCYFYRNVMNKIVIHKKREATNRRARNISSIILNDEEIFKFLKFIKNDYGNLLDSPLA